MSDGIWLTDYEVHLPDSSYTSYLVTQLVIILCYSLVKKTQALL